VWFCGWATHRDDWVQLEIVVVMMFSVMAMIMMTALMMIVLIF